MLLVLRGVGIIVKGALFVGVIVAHIKKDASEKWLAAPVLLFGIIPLLYGVFLDFRRFVSSVVGRNLRILFVLFCVREILYLRNRFFLAICNILPEKNENERKTTILTNSAKAC